MSKKNFRIVVFCLLGNGLVLLVVGAAVRNVHAKTVLLSLTGGFFLAAALQIVIYRMKPQLFDDKEAGLGGRDGEGS